MTDRIDPVVGLPPAVIALERMVLQHPMHEAAKKAIRLLHQRAVSRDGRGDRLTSAMLMLLGETRVGKSRVLEDYSSLYPTITKETVEAGGPGLPTGVRHSLLDADYRPIVMAGAKAAGDLRSLVSSILLGFGYTAKPEWDVPKLIEMIRHFALEMSTAMIFIDEGHNLFNLANAVTTAEIANFLRQLLNDVPCQLVVAGLPELKDLVPFAPQLKGRVEPPFRLRSYHWTGDDLKLYIGLLRRFERELRLPEPSDLGSHDFSRRMYVASLDGRIGWIVKLLSRALIIAIERELPCIDLNLMGEVYASFSYEDEPPGEAAAQTPDFMDPGLFRRTVISAAARLVPDVDNPFLCDPLRLADIRLGLLQRLDVERRDLERKIRADRSPGSRRTRLTPRAPAQTVRLSAK